jgi:drug/metabolite transporter (DMT)-like permease
MPTLQVSQPVVAAVLGVAVLDEKLNTGLAGAAALVVAGLVMAAAIFKLAGVEAVAAGNGFEGTVQDSVSSSI